MAENETQEYNSDYWVDRAERYWSESNRNEQAAREAMSFIERAISLNPLNHRAWSDKGFILKQMGELESALLCIDRALALNRDFVSSWYNKGVLLGLLGKFDEAIICYEEVLKHNPQHRFAIRDMNILKSIISKGK
ncbi:tetratricopeptide repeat protein [[Eubacterium] cellulosolvens]